MSIFVPGRACVQLPPSVTHADQARFGSSSEALKWSAKRKKNSPPLCSVGHGLRGDGGPGRSLKGTARGAIVARGCGTGATSKSSRTLRLARATGRLVEVGCPRRYGSSCLIDVRGRFRSGSGGRRIFSGSLLPTNFGSLAHERRPGWPGYLCRFPQKSSGRW